MIAAVRVSCLAVADRPVRLAEVFYAHLFEMAPQLRAMFPPDQQAVIISSMLKRVDVSNTTGTSATL